MLLEPILIEDFSITILFYRSPLGGTKTSLST
jgi:hypothetical protein